MTSYKDIVKRKRELKQWIGENRPKSFLVAEFKCRHTTLNKALQVLGITYHGNMGCKGYKHDPKRLSAIELSKKRNVNGCVFRKRLIEDGIKKHKCERCKLTKWLDKKIPLETHHIDGNKYNNLLYNIKLLCPNCHALENNNSGACTKKRFDNAPIAQLVGGLPLRTETV